MRPNFLIIGAMKAGTTALYHTLKQHPQVFMSPVKEPHFFSYEGRTSSREHIITTWDEYEKLYDNAGDALARGEASPSYLPAPQAPVTIHKYVPDCKLIAVLRHPVERAYSHYLHLYKEGRESNDDFLTAFEQNEATANQRGNSWNSYKNQGFYASHLARYYKLFPREQVKIFLYDDYIADANAVIREMFEFLGVQPDFSAEQRWYYKSGKPKSRLMHNIIKGKFPLIKSLAKLIPQDQRARLKTNLHNRNVQQEKLSPAARAALLPIYREDTLALADMIGRDLSAWMK